MGKNYFFLLTMSLWMFSLFSLSDHPSEPRYYCPPSSLPSTSYMPDINITEYKSKFEKLTPEWLIEAVNTELDFFKRHPITQQGLNATYSRITSHGFPRTHYLRRYRIIGERIYAYGIVGETETDLILRTIARLSDFPGIPDLPNVDFMINHNDGMPMSYDPPNFWITESENDQAPVLSGGRRKDAPYIALIPHRCVMPNWNSLMHKTLGSRCPWNEKIRAAAWRGNIVLTDVDIISSPDQKLLDALTWSPRCIISSLSLQYPDLINAGFSPNLDWIPSETLKKAVSPLIQGHLAARDHIRYAYLPIIDGVMPSGGGYEWRLFSDSLVLKPDSPYLSWYEYGLKPYTHYLPIQGDLSDLVEKIHWARSNDAQCEQIANNGTVFATDHLQIEGLYFYIFRLLEQYQKCQAFNTAELLQECESDPNWVRIR